MWSISRSDSYGREDEVLRILHRTVPYQACPVRDQVMNLFRVYGVLDYLDECYGALHVMGPDCILDDLESLIDEGGYVSNGSDRF